VTQDTVLMPLVAAVEAQTGLRPHLSTCLRWCSRGSAGIKLESQVLGGRRYTTIAAVAKYVEAVTAKKSNCPAPVQAATPRQSDAAAEKSAKKLRDRLAKR